MKKLKSIFTFIFLSLSLFAQEEKKPPAGMFVPNFRDVEIQDFLKTMAQITQRNILLDETVKGKITIVAYKPLPVKNALDFLKTVLDVRGYTVIDEDGILKVTKKKDAEVSSELREKELSKKNKDIITKIYQVPKQFSVRELSELFRKLGGNEITIQEFFSTNSILLIGNNRVIHRLLEIANRLALEKLDTSKAIETETVHIYQVKNLQAESLANVLVKLDAPAQPKDDKQPQPSGKIKAVAHKESNSVIVIASKDEWFEIRRIIEMLDQKRQQILLEVLIAEITGSSIDDFGIDWRYVGPNAGYTQFNTGLAIEGNLVDSSGNITGNNTLAGFSIGFLQKGGDILGIFNANISNRNFNVLSSPQILTLDNQEAEINVGQDVPVKTQERTTGGGTSEATINSFEYRPAGIKLKFTPHINAEGIINLELFTEVTNIEGGLTSGVNPTFNKRNVKTFINVENKQTIVIGGLVSTETLKAIRKIPLLGDIPLIGFLFRRTTYTTKKTNLMVFITPILLDDLQMVKSLTETKMNQQRIDVKKAENKIILWPQKKEENEKEKFYNQIDDQPYYIDPKRN